MKKYYDILLMKKIRKIMLSQSERPALTNLRQNEYGGNIGDCPRCGEYQFVRTYPQHWGSKHVPRNLKEKAIIDLFRSELAKGREI